MINFLIIIAICFIFYWRTINYDYIIDDNVNTFLKVKVTYKNSKEERLYNFPPTATDELIEKTVKDSSNGMEINSMTPDSGCRITRKWHIDLWRQIVGDCYTNPKVEHLITTIIHTINCCLIYWLFGCNNISLLTALLFALNPVNNQCSIWLSGKPYSLSTMAMLLGLCILPSLPIFYAFSLWFSANTIMLPILFTFKQPHWYILALPILGIFFSWRIRRTIKRRYDSAPTEAIKFSINKLIIFFKTLGYYFVLCLFPVKIGMFHSYLNSYSMNEEANKKWYKIDIYFIIGLLLTCIVIANLFLKFTPQAYGLLWFFIFSIQYCNILLLNHPITERYIYLANIGLMYLLALSIISTPFMWIFLTAYAIRLFYFTPAYKNMISYWKSNIENFPDVALGYNQYALALNAYGNGGSALDSLVSGVQYEPRDFKVNYNLANMLIQSGMTDKAVKFIKVAEETLYEKDDPKVVNVFKEGIANMKRACKDKGLEV